MDDTSTPKADAGTDEIEDLELTDEAAEDVAGGRGNNAKRSLKKPAGGGAERARY